MKNKNKTVLYISYIDMNNAISGSAVRPLAMYNAFVELGYNVISIKEIASKDNKINRIKAINMIKEWLNYNIPDFCYIESPGDPIIFKEDRKLIKFIKNKKIKIAYFYRDAYYKVGKDCLGLEQNSKFILKDNLRYFYYKFLYWRDELLLRKYVNIIYFPSMEMAKYFKFKKIGILPPAGYSVDILEGKRDALIYVGGISKRYGIDLLLDSINIINQKQHIDLLLVCREKELKYIKKIYFNAPWLKIIHASGQEDLKKIYSNAKIAIIPVSSNVYNNFAIPIKLYEYMSYGLPIVSTNLTEVTKIIKRYNIGLISENDSEKLASTIMNLYNNQELIKIFATNSKKFLLKENLWLHRVKKIEEDIKCLKG